MRYQAPRGTHDVLPSESHAWAWVENEFRSVSMLYGYGEIRTPIFEDTELFTRTAGETSDIVTKEMYTFTDKGGRSVTLKPEGTAPALRAALEGGLYQQGAALRLSYITDFFRYERPQKGRYRQARQMGLELIGANSAEADAEIIEIVVRFYERVGLQGLVVKINSLGREECRTNYRAALLEFAKGSLTELSTEDQARIAQNPLRILDMKDPKIIEAMADAPSILDFLEPESVDRFERLQTLLVETGIEFAITPTLVRGLDYYTETVFEVHGASLGSQNAMCGGGRYDGLIRELGGPPTPAVGVGIGIERLVMVLDAEQLLPQAPNANVFVARLEDGSLQARELVRRLRTKCLIVATDVDGKSLKAQARMADKSGANRMVIVGGEELQRGCVVVRDLKSGDQAEVPLEEAVMRLCGR